MWDETIGEKMRQAQGIHWALDWMAEHEIMSDRTAEMYHRRLHLLERGWVEIEKGVPFTSQQYQRQAD